MGRREGPDDVLPRQSGIHMDGIGDVFAVIVSDEVIAQGRPESYEDNRRQKETDQDPVVRQG
jgi:hypothetical protein